MVGTPFFNRQLELCKSMRWKLWSGYYAVDSYLVHHDQEYYAIRSAAGLLDITPLYKYLISGEDSAAFLSQVMVRDITRLGEGRVIYTCWCDHKGKVVGDGTVMRLEPSLYLVTTTDACYSWLRRFTEGYTVKVEDHTDQIAALALQGPCSREILQRISQPEILKTQYFEVQHSSISGQAVWISRTGYTGDLGYELWMDRADALAVWDALMRAGKDFALRPVGLMALDVCRLEAGLILKHVEYHNALHALTEDRKSSPYEISLGWTVQLDRPPFNGQKALRREKETGSQWALKGLVIDWEETEHLYYKAGLPPALCSEPWRTSVPIYHDVGQTRQVGYATSGTWSPLLKKNIALATIRSGYAKTGSKLQIEMMVEHVRHSVTATVTSQRFYNPPHKTYTPK